MPFVHSLVANIYAVSLTTISIAAIMWCLERLLPRGKVSIASQVRSLTFWIFAGLGTATAITIYGSVFKLLQPTPLYVIPLNTWLQSPALHWSMYIVAPVLGIIL